MTSFLPAILALAVLSLLQFSFSRLYNHYVFSIASSKLGCAAPKTLPSRDPLFGIDTVVSTFKSIKNHCRMRTAQKQTHLYGHTFQSFPFGRRVVMTVSPRNVQTVLSLEHEKFGVGPIRRPAEAMVGKGIISNDGKVWEHGRSMIRPAFARSQIADRGMFERHVGRLIALLPQDNSVVDLQPLFDKLILDASSEFIFGESFDSLLPDSPIDSQKFMDAFNTAQKGVGIRVILGKMKFLIMRDRKFQESCDIIKQYTRRHVDRALDRREERKKDNARKTVLVYELAEETTDRSDLTSQLLNVFFAGRDTPAVALTNLFFLLARHPKVWKRCKEEAQGLDKDDLSFEKLKSLRYIQHVINEAMRLLPPVAAQTRTCLTATTLPTGGGLSGNLPVYVVPGDTIAINFFTLHRDPSIFGPDPEAFRPERWTQVRPTWEFLPFGGGARHCPAQQLALFWVAYTFVRMLLGYNEIKNEDEVEEYVENMKLNMESHNGAKVSFVST
ncbi:cytochrome P450 alkane hydroxylase-like protein [Paraphoma chrysanthemicola]|uniref:Cytochrome P450 alkane hydroxylase-like protein n=1 Tax=Paraphoma chrysanthemicola TaxID=798071 RepID=A0A8K0W3A0_9PLEO|nr:cytochrome P450 alkane hydroxylase-like protein [Paraphoma chrysanthemicola]